MPTVTFKADSQILSELGSRLKIARIRAGLSQSELAKNSGVAKSTIERAEKGESIQLTNFIKLLRALNLLSGLETLLPSTEKTPMEYLQSSEQELPKRVHKQKQENKGGFVWGDEK